MTIANVVALVSGLLAVILFFGPILILGPKRQRMFRGMMREGFDYAENPQSMEHFEAYGEEYIRATRIIGYFWLVALCCTLVCTIAVWL